VIFPLDPIRKIARVIVPPHSGGTAPWNSAPKGFGLFLDDPDRQNSKKNSRRGATVPRRKIFRR